MTDDLAGARQRIAEIVRDGVRGRVIHPDVLASRIVEAEIQPLTKYLRHNPACILSYAKSWAIYRPEHCDCGLTTALARLKGDT